MLNQGRRSGKTAMINAIMRALYEEIFIYRLPEIHATKQVPYRYTRAYGKRSNWIKRKR